MLGFPATSTSTVATAAASGSTRPTPAMQIANFVVFQAAWFAAILGAAHRAPLLGTAAIVAAIAWHVTVSARPAQEARLIAIVALVGLVVETLNVAAGHVSFPSGQPLAHVAPYWMVALWALLGIALNVTMRWLKSRPVLAALLGAVAGPLSFLGGVRLGGAQFIDETSALVIMALTWAVLMPALMWLSERFDGVSVPRRVLPIKEAP